MNGTLSVFIALALLVVGIFYAVNKRFTEAVYYTLVGIFFVLLPVGIHIP